MRTLRRIRDWLARRSHLLPHTACVPFLLLTSVYCQAQPPAAADARVMEGKVQRYTTAPRGEIDGALLDNGSSLHWPPHLQDRFTSIVAQGARVRATGRTERGPKGDVHFEVETVTNTQSNVSATNPDFAFGPPQPPNGPRGRGRRGPPPPPAFGPGRLPPAGRGDSADTQGTVTRITTAPMGEVDGAVLDNGTWLHWPPHMQNTFANLVKAGDRVRATGRTETGPAGDTHFEVQSVTNTRTGVTVENPDAVVMAPPGNALRRDATPDRERRLQDLQQQIEQLQRELERLRRE